jgi:hypothetical protein
MRLSYAELASRVIGLVGIMVLLALPVAAQLVHYESTGRCQGGPYATGSGPEPAQASPCGPDYLWADAQDTVLYVTHVSALRNCAVQFYMEYRLEGNHLWVIEHDTTRELATCECCRDLGSDVYGLPPGEYVVTLLIADSTGAIVDTIGTMNAVLMYNDAPASPQRHLPSAFSLSQNFPNPTNPGTSIQFALPRSSVVKLEIFNITGQLVATLADKRFSAGEHTVTWTGNGADGRAVPSGVYLYRLTAGEFASTKKMVILK